MTCNDCIHYGLCDCGCGFGVCNNFKDKLKFIELPLMPGDKAYILTYRQDRSCYVSEIQVYSLTIDTIDMVITACQGHGNTGFFYGIDVFATKEEAEQKLKEMDV